MPESARDGAIAEKRRWPKKRATGRRLCACGGPKDFYALTCLACTSDGQARLNPTFLVCPICHESFRVKRSHSAIKTYCSMACMAAGYRIRLVGHGNPNHNARHMKPRSPGRFRVRKDLNHDEVVSAFERCGCPTLDLHTVGRGAPDILVFCRKIRMVEIKNPTNDYGKRGLSENQKAFNEEWGNVVYECCGPEDAVAMVAAWRSAST